MKKVNINNFINNTLLTSDIKLKDIIQKQLYGLNCYSGKILEERIETFKEYNFSTIYSYKWVVLLKTLISIVPLNKSIKDRFLLNIFYLDLIMSYRGWRHSRGLPVRGQRTWTNAWTTYRSNLVLREYKIIIAKRLYGSLPLDDLSVAHLAEQTNLLWKLQWENEWKEARKKRLVAMKTNVRSTSVDLYSMSKGIVDTSSNKKSKKKVKSHFGKNLFTLGFDPGFAKALIKANYISNINSKKKTKQSKVTLIFGKSNMKKK